MSNERGQDEGRRDPATLIARAHELRDRSRALLERSAELTRGSAEAHERARAIRKAVSERAAQDDAPA